MGGAGGCGGGGLKRDERRLPTLLSRREPPREPPEEEAGACIGPECPFPERAEILQNYLRAQARYTPAPYAGSLQPHLSSRRRAMLVDWLVEVGDDRDLDEETLHLSVALLDRFLATAEPVPLRRLQLIGTACMHIAAKVEEVHPPAGAQLTRLCDGAYTLPEMLEAERDILNTLQFRLNPPTPTRFLDHFLEVARGGGDAGCARDTADARPVRDRAMFLLDRALLEYDVCVVDAGTLTAPATRAAAAALAALEGCQGRDAPDAPDALTASRYRDRLAAAAGVPPSVLAECRDRLVSAAETRVPVFGGVRLEGVSRKYGGVVGGEEGD